MATRRQGLKRIKKRPLSERSEFRTLPVSVRGGAASPCEARGADRHRRGRLFCPTFLAEQKSGSAAGTNTRLLPTAVSAATLHPPGSRSNSALKLRSRNATATATPPYRETVNPPSS